MKNDMEKELAKKAISIDLFIIESDLHIDELVTPTKVIQFEIIISKFLYSLNLSYLKKAKEVIKPQLRFLVLGNKSII